MESKFSEIATVDDVNKFIEKINYVYIDQKKEERILYHYTSGESLKGIIEDEELRITKSEFLNDKGEIKYTHSTILKIIDEFMASNPSEEEDGFKSLIERGIDEEEFLADSYVMPFSTNKDSNLLWSNYANNDGYNIGFRYPEIEEILNLNINGSKDKFLDQAAVVLSNNVIYDEDKQREYLSTEIICMYKIYIYCKKNEQLDKFFEYISKNKVNIFLHSLFFKASCFKQEEEFRIVIMPGNRVNSANSLKCRFTNGVFIPYFKSSIINNSSGKIRLPIESITIGPKNNLDIAENGLRYFLNLNDLDENMVKIKKSNIPYRY
ncbi:DUF2971 domain-containing protein [Inconstantimicrobium mannanitabidum]|uniref:Uncharacterized protein n=1 Tax=Inconstantimicrobium mannanitabidum TaxID=1604901 RepID=A0ACB5R792_9CLOT|nr:DUF2971 domain-containing protein [Clostridium sp. TW13]GKX64871.1 hypothetical protein rsdtw13_01290 [Clostridium sp. TW13]